MEVNFGNELWFFLNCLKNKSISCGGTVSGSVTKQQVLSEPEASWVFWDVKGDRGLSWPCLAWLWMAEWGLRWPVSLAVRGQGITQGFSLGSVSASACWVLIMTWDLPVCGSGCQNRAEEWSLCPSCTGDLWSGIFPFTSSVLAASSDDFQFN